MEDMNPSVDNYLVAGCGRCPLGNTPQCKVNNWSEELTALRLIVLESGLAEELKWGVPCYTWKGTNVLIVSAFNDSCTISFFKGVLLGDVHKVLAKPGENTQSARVIRFTDVRQIVEMENIIKEYIQEAIELEEQGAQVNFKKNPEPVPKELQNRFDDDPILESSFYALTPGRQRGYILYFSQPKQPKTRLSRIEKFTPKILNGIGIHDR